MLPLRSHLRPSPARRRAPRDRARPPAPWPPAASRPHHADLDVAEPGARHAMADMPDLTRLALAAVRRAEHPPARRVADRVHRPPELVRDPRVRPAPVQLSKLAALDLTADLGRELEVQAPVVNGPAPVRLEEQAVVGVLDDLLERPSRLGEEVDVRHPDQRDPVPAV